ncbi:hypothetical protein ACQ4LE_002207 [Meloidogyne hapla]|uniref:Uncharacterized protein n=1 Tax=Meloidogyne hapla TaxID=6305 RepID=A0A1I8BT52_MELHA
MLDLNPDNWNKENIWPSPVSTIINPPINSLVNEQREELENKKSCLNLKINKKVGNNEYLEDENFKIKRGRFEFEKNVEENKGAGEAEGMVNLCWWSQRRRDHKEQFSSSRCLFPVADKIQNLSKYSTEETQKLESSSKKVETTARIVLGELFCYVLSPFKQQCSDDEDDELQTCSTSSPNSKVFCPKQLNVLPV